MLTIACLRRVTSVLRALLAAAVIVALAGAACTAAARGERGSPRPTPHAKPRRSPHPRATRAPTAAVASPSPRATAAAAGGERLEGFGSSTRGGEDGREVWVTAATTDALRAALLDVNKTGYAILRFDVHEPIMVHRPLPYVTAPYVTIDGHGATIDGSELRNEVALIDVRAHDVIVRDLRLRNGYDNLRAQSEDAHDVVFSHISSTGSMDDGLSVAGGAHDVTAQYLFLAGNTRSVFCKDGGTNLSLHHTWIQKGWIRSPLVSGPTAHADLRNVVVEDWGEWGSRFENGATGNVVDSLFVLSEYANAHGGKPDALRAISGAAVYTSGNAFRGAAHPPEFTSAPRPFPAPPVATDPVERMADRVRARAGCLPRDAVDLRYVGRTTDWRVGVETPLRLDAD